MKEKVVVILVFNVFILSIMLLLLLLLILLGGKIYRMEFIVYLGGGIIVYGINLSVNFGLKVIVVDLWIILFGFKVWVEGYGEVIVGDIGGVIKGNIVDVYFLNES